MRCPECKAQLKLSATLESQSPRSPRHIPEVSPDQVPVIRHLLRAGGPGFPVPSKPGFRVCFFPDDSHRERSFSEEGPFYPRSALYGAYQEAIATGFFALAAEQMGRGAGGYRPVSRAMFYRFLERGLGLRQVKLTGRAGFRGFWEVAV